MDSRRLKNARDLDRKAAKILTETVLLDAAEVNLSLA